MNHVRDRHTLMGMTAAHTARPVIEPRLRFGGVVARGLLYGIAGAILLMASSLTVSDHDGRLTYLAVFAGFALVIGIVTASFGGFFWLASRNDVRRFRDWRPISGRYDGVAIMAPVMVRTAAFCLVLFIAGVAFYSLVSAARYGTSLGGSF
jgi:fatty acid desaturase